LYSRLLLQVLIPGDPEREAEGVRSLQGIPVKKAVVVDMRDICNTINVHFDF
jgi:LDH2 family malate/lactate/ureidoglycolate dehydrogenase